MAHAAAHIKKARLELEPSPDAKALEKARERRRKSRERAERKRKPLEDLPCHLLISVSSPSHHADIALL
uniref:Uncharacterized protein n=1 Tax=Knipowitschia caucasica TaxID=637954 RepID=A0AAV2KM25_KNICA